MSFDLKKLIENAKSASSQVKSDEAVKRATASDTPVTNFGVINVTANTGDQFSLGSLYDLGTSSTGNAFNFVPLQGVAPGFIGTGIVGDPNTIQHAPKTDFNFNVGTTEGSSNTWTVPVADQWAIEATAKVSGGSLTITSYILYESAEGPFFRFGNVVDNVGTSDPAQFVPSVGGTYTLDWGNSSTISHVQFKLDIQYNTQTGAVSGNASMQLNFN